MSINKNESSYDRLSWANFIIILMIDRYSTKGQEYGPPLIYTNELPDSVCIFKYKIMSDD